MLNNKVVLITGGTGSFGKKFIETILTNYRSVKKIIIFSRDEMKQYEMKNQLNKHKNMRFFLGDIRDLDRLKFAFKDVDFVIIDGPDVGRYNIDATTNAADLKKKYPKNKIKVFIQGRISTQKWYGFKSKNNNAWGEL